MHCIVNMYGGKVLLLLVLITRRHFRNYSTYKLFQIEKEALLRKKMLRSEQSNNKRTKGISVCLGILIEIPYLFLKSFAVYVCMECY